MTIFKKTDYIYTSLFCEENIWKLVGALYTNPLAKPIDVLFILNKSNTISLFHQAQSDSNEPVIWDYHVILHAQMGGDSVIFDYDSRCGFPVKINEYFSKTFKPEINLKDRFKPYIKSIPAEYYLRHFFSNRQHMAGIIEQKAFPDYDIIEPIEKTERLTLEQCRNIKHRVADKEIVSPKEFLFNLIY